MGRQIRYALSVALPLATHVTRQAMACSEKKFPSYVFTIFLAAYAFAMLAMSVSSGSRTTLRIAIPAFALTFVAAICSRNDPTIFAVAWALHALPSATFWPIAFQYVHGMSKNRIHLAAWSLQGNIGDLFGCLYPAFYPSWELPFLMGSLILATLLFACWLAVEIGTDHTSGTLCAARGEALIAAPTARVSRGRVVWSEVGFLVVGTTSLKSATYFASNFMPQLHIGYVWYGVASATGVVLSGVIFELGIPYTFTCVAASGLVATAAANRHLPAPLVATCLGAMSSFCSTMLSICICSDVSERMKHYGKVTAILDGTGSLTAAVVQLVPRDRFFVVQTVLFSMLTISVAVAGFLRSESRCHPSLFEQRPSGSSGSDA